MRWEVYSVIDRYGDRAKFKKKKLTYEVRVNVNEILRKYAHKCKYAIKSVVCSTSSEF